MGVPGGADNNWGVGAPGVFDIPGTPGPPRAISFWRVAISCSGGKVLISGGRLASSSGGMGPRGLGGAAGSLPDRSILSVSNPSASTLVARSGGSFARGLVEVVEFMVWFLGHHGQLRQYLLH